MSATEPVAYIVDKDDLLRAYVHRSEAIAAWKRGAATGDGAGMSTLTADELRWSLSADDYPWLGEMSLVQLVNAWNTQHANGAFT